MVPGNSEHRRSRARCIPLCQTSKELRCELRPRRDGWPHFVFFAIRNATSDRDKIHWADAMRYANAVVGRQAEQRKAPELRDESDFHDSRAHVRCAAKGGTRDNVVQIRNDDEGQLRSPSLRNCADGKQGDRRQQCEGRTTCSSTIRHRGMCGRA